MTARNPSRRDTLKLLSAGALLSRAVAGQPQSKRQPALTDQLRIGTEFFLNRSETRDGVRRHFKLMRGSGLTLVRVFVIWDDIEREPGVWNFDRYDWLFDAAAENGIKMVTTLCSEDPPGWRHETPFYHNRTNLNDPRVRSQAAEYIRRVVNRYREHPAQGVWLLMNEPSKYDREPATLRAFGEWLHHKYGTLGNLNRHWFHKLKDFSNLTITDEMLAGGNYGWLDYPPIVDWREFNIDNLVNQLLWIKSQILLYDTEHPTHLNVTQPLGGPHGQDVWKEEKVVDILGASIHPAWMLNPSAPHSAYGELVARRLDVIAGPSGTKPWWVTEFQGGPTVFTGRFPFNPTPADLTRWMWDAYGAGGRAVIFWLWNPREGGQEGGEWGLVGPRGEPSIRLPAVRDVGEGLKKIPLLGESQPQKAAVALLYNRETAILGNLEGGRFQHRGDEWEQSIDGCYLALRRAHIPVQFVDLDQLKQAAVKSFNVLYAPYCYAIDDGAVAALREYVRDGGTLWADGLIAWKNEMGRIRPGIPGDLSDLFGVEAHDIYPVKQDQPYSITAQNEQAGELWKLPLQLKGAEPFLRDREGKPFAVRNRFGRGEAIYFESALSLAYAKRGNPQIQEWIIRPARQFQSKLPVQVLKGSPEAQFRGLVHSKGAFALLSNWGDAQGVAVGFRGQFNVVDALSRKTFETSSQEGLTVARATIPADAVLILEAHR